MPGLKLGLGLGLGANSSPGKGGGVPYPPPAGFRWAEVRWMSSTAHLNSQPCFILIPA